MSHASEPAGFASTEVQNPWLYRWALGVVALVLIAPLWTVGTLPWQDYGDHLARVYIFAHYQDVPLFQNEFEIEAGPLPNLAMDAIATPLLWVFSADFVAHLFPTILILVFVAGCQSFSKVVHGTANWLVLPTVFLIYNLMLMWGFVNYMFSVGLFLVAAASWLRFRRQPTWGRGAWATLAAVATYFAHLAGFFFLCVFVGIHVIVAGVDAIKARKSGFPIRALVLLLPLAPGLALYFYLLITGDLGEMVVVFESFPEKLERIWTVFGSYLTGGGILVAGGLLTAVTLALLDGRWKLERTIGWVTLCFWAMYFAFPLYYHTSSQVDTRFLLPAIVLPLLSLSIRMPRLGARTAYGLVMAGLLLHLGGLVDAWRTAEQEASEQRSLLGEIEPESLVYAMPFVQNGEGLRMSLMHIGGYATLDRNAAVSTTFGVPGQQLLRWREAPPEVEPSDPAREADWDRILDRFDYVWLYEAPPEVIALMNANGELVDQAGEGRLYRVTRPH